MTARILLVDDDPGLSEVVELLLTREGYAVARAGTVKAGLERIRRARIDLVVTDLRLPDGTGLDAIGAIRRLRPELPIIQLLSSRVPSFTFHPTSASAEGSQSSSHAPGG